MKKISLLLVFLLLAGMLPVSALAVGENGKTKDDYVSLDSLAREYGHCGPAPAAPAQD